ncbi:hypothetical protein ATPR_3047 [Acetobacter tropicalis NBRC 101654]|uniref:Uncharacterized protein n=1 Tax=Acetobacter tropicalis NBRC 101654 TaxID=749388 RepID=F7VI49_9PROT|nr:hypothetical protein ATPR_3047 [Acetobacter tropicalis NBRC 101654]
MGHGERQWRTEQPQSCATGGRQKVHENAVPWMVRSHCFIKMKPAE